MKKKRLFVILIFTFSLLSLASCAPGGGPSGPQGEEKTCVMSITCATVLDNWDKLAKGKEEIIPEGGVILPETQVALLDGESAFDVLLRVTKELKIHMEHSQTPITKISYIEAINNLYEFDCGELSGWMYQVNGVYPACGSNGYEMQDGDNLKWVYTCDLGRDIGGDWSSQNQ